MIKKKEPFRLLKVQKQKLFDEWRDTLPGLSRELRREIVRSHKGVHSLHTDRQVDRWLAARLATPTLQVNTTSLLGMRGWLVDGVTGDISHESGRFFSLTGAHVRHRTPEGELEWDQPIIDQAEVGILGILAKKINGVLHFCLQAKEEPGNINSVQLSPTVQATFSNYTRVHGGSSPPLLDYFLGGSGGRVIYAKLQTEDGGRFLYKSNRNMIVQVHDDSPMELPDGFIWLTIRQIARLLGHDNVIHACTRSILAALVVAEEVELPGRTAARVGAGIGGSIEETVQWLDDQKAANHILVKRRPLSGLKEWGMDRDGSFSQEEGRFFRVIGIEAASAEREVASWDQPILDNPGTGIIGLLTRVYKGERYFLMQAKVELGNRNIVQIGPTVQFTPGNYIGNTRLPKPFLFDEFYHGGRFHLLSESMQSEEGARFFREAHLHRILTLPDGVELELPRDFRWISQADLHLFVHMGETVNSCARSVLSLLI